jgi:uncharacterized NAD(P)/FAD-binding protein YdhS
MYPTTQRIVDKRGRFSVAAAAGYAWRAATAIVAPSDAPREDPLGLLLPAGAPRYVRTPWSARELARIGADDRVLVLGAGLAAANLVAALEQQWHRALIRIVSQSALVPQRLAELLATGRADVRVGRIGGAASFGDTFVVDVLPYGRKLYSSERYHWIVDCTS